MDSEKNFSLDELIEKGKHDGSISNEDLLDAIGGYQDFDMDQIDKIYETLETNGIEITDGISDDKFADLESEVEQMMSPEEIEKMQRLAVDSSRLGIPILFGMDVIHGYETIFPIPLGLSCSWDMEAVELSARIAAEEASSDGICWTFSPMVDVSRDPRWGRVSEGSGEDTYLGSRIAEAMVRGYQGEDISDKDRLAACLKHFAGYGMVEGGRDYNTVDMSPAKLYNDILPPFKACVDAGVETVMTALSESAPSRVSTVIGTEAPTLASAEAVILIRKSLYPFSPRTGKAGSREHFNPSELIIASSTLMLQSSGIF